MIFKILSIVSGIKLTLFFLIFFFNILHLLKPRKILIYPIIPFNRNKGYKPLTSLLIDSFDKKVLTLFHHEEFYSYRFSRRYGT